MSSSINGVASRFSVAFLDRDGTIISDPGYLADPDGVELLQGSAEAVRLLNSSDIPVIIVTNQSGIGRGLYGEPEFRAVQVEVERLLEQSGARIDAVYHCPHAPDEGCECRKPALGMYARAAEELGVDLSRALYVGDRRGDVLPAMVTGGTALLVAASNGRYDDSVPAECVRAPDLLTGVRAVLGGTSQQSIPESEEG